MVSGVSKRGRKRKFGKRHPSGDLVNPQMDTVRAGLPPSAVRRLMLHAKELALDPLLSSQLGLLHHTGKITDTELAAGTKVSAIYGTYASLQGLPRRSARTANLGTGSGSEPPANPDDVLIDVRTPDEIEEAIESATRQWERLQAILMVYSGPLGGIRCRGGRPLRPEPGHQLAASSGHPKGFAEGRGRILDLSRKR
jgi:hypothetical protein